ncbi:terminase gpA endonuclease subunit [Methylobacterium sp. MA0201]|uniref:terminase gpA endonuclease subunit n=1 Tax=Methylobacterium alsaeris TaxID=3344826 RepID=UPI003756955E
MRLSTHELDPRILRALGELTKPGLEAARRMIVRCGRNLVPNAPMGNRAWIESHLWNPTGNRQGWLRLDNAQGAIADALDLPWVRKVEWLKPPRSGSSTLTAALHIKKAAHDAANNVFYERTDGEAQNWSEKKLQPILKASTRIAHLVRPDSRSGTQDSWSDITLLNGAMIQCRGVQTDSNFKAIDGEQISLDEGGDPAFKSTGKGKEGSKVGQAATRSAQYAEPKMYIGGTPTTPDCMVVEEWEKSDKRTMRLRFPCCPDRPQELEPKVSEAGTPEEIRGGGLKFRCRDVTYDDGTVTREVAEIGYECAHCGRWMREDERNGAMEGAPFVATTQAKEKGNVGFYTWAIHSKDPSHRWGLIVAKYLSQRANPAERQDWTNLWLALPYVVAVEGRIDPHELEARCEPYEAPCPAGVRRIYAGIDAQEGSAKMGRPPRHEAVVVGYGAGKERWVLGRYVIDRTEVVDPDTGEIVHETLDPFGPDAARQIWALLDKEWVKPDGTTLKVSKAAVDIGFDWSRALAFCHHRESKRRKVVAVRGGKEARGSRRAPISTPPDKRQDRKATTYVLVGGGSLKDTLFQALGLPVGRPESLHFPDSLRGTDFFHQLTAECLQSDDQGRTWWDKHGAKDEPNEVLDCVIYADAAMLIDLANPRNSTARDDLGVDLNGTREVPEPYEGEDRSDQAGAPKHVTAGTPRSPGRRREEATKARAARVEAVLQRLPEEKRDVARARLQEVDAALTRAIEARRLDAAAPPAPPPPKPVARAVRRPNRFLNW